MDKTRKEEKNMRQTCHRLNGIKRGEKEKTNSPNRTKLKKTKEKKTTEKKRIKDPTYEVKRQRRELLKISDNRTCRRCLATVHSKKYNNKSNVSMVLKNKGIHSHATH